MLPDHDTCLAPLGRMEVVAHEPWLVGAFSQLGHGHAKENIPMGDAYCIGRVGDLVYLAVADGVSSAPKSQLGAQLAVATIAARVTQSAQLRIRSTSNDVSGIFETARDAIGREAKNLRCPIAHFATTLMLAILDDRSIIVAKIGDGSVFAVETDRSSARLVPLVDSPNSQEGVVDLTHRDWKSHLRVRHIADRHLHGIDTVALATDGAAGYFMTPSATPTVAGERTGLTTTYLHEELQRQIAERGPRDLVGYFAQLMFLKSQRETFDDRTLVVATALPSRRPA